MSHDIQLTENPRFLSKMASYGVTSTIDVACHVMELTSNPGFLTYLASYDVASNRCFSPHHGTHFESSLLESCVII